MIDFSYYDSIPFRYFTEDELSEAREDLDYHTKKITGDLSDIKNDKFYIGVHLIEFFKSAAWSSDPGWISPKLGLNGKIQGYKSSLSFFMYCEKHFDLDKSQVSRYMNIVDEFGDGYRGYKERYRNYKYSSLVEMLSLTEDQRKEITPDMTVAQIRAYKNKFVATSQQKEQPGDCVDNSGSSESVATSQQKVYFIKASDFPLNEYCNYRRFIGCSDRHVCDEVFAAEAKLRDLEKRYNELNALLNIKNNSEVTA